MIAAMRNQAENRKAASRTKPVDVATDRAKARTWNRRAAARSATRARQGGAASG
jgi:hypothetical protein